LRRARSRNAIATSPPGCAAGPGTVVRVVRGVAEETGGRRGRGADFAADRGTPPSQVLWRANLP
ncbi:MAG: hypothetical protein AB1671_19785, partial [Thermodesulfobacteriota bacterium]